MKLHNKFKMSLAFLMIVIMMSPMFASATQVVGNRNFDQLTYSGITITGFTDWSENALVSVSTDSQSGSYAARVVYDETEFPASGELTQTFSPILTDTINHISLFVKLTDSWTAVLVKISLYYGSTYVDGQTFGDSDLSESYSQLSVNMNNIVDGQQVNKIQIATYLNGNYVGYDYHEVLVDSLSFDYTANNGGGSGGGSGGGCIRVFCLDP